MVSLLSRKNGSLPSRGALERNTTQRPRNSPGDPLHCDFQDGGLASRDRDVARRRFIAVIIQIDLMLTLGYFEVAATPTTRLSINIDIGLIGTDAEPELAILGQQGADSFQQKERYKATHQKHMSSIVHSFTSFSQICVS